jgi:urea transport system substrate-binding protein
MVTTAGRLSGSPVRPARVEALNVALVVPLQGPAGIFGPSCRLCAQLAAEEVNAGPGVLGREVRLVVVDGGAPPGQVADEVDALITRGEVDAVTGWHISAVREVVAPRIAGRVPYVYSPLYEGGERSPWVFLAGETPDRQLGPALRWFAAELGISRWTIVGDDYVWPRVSARASRHYVAELGGTVCDEIYVRLGTEDFDAVLGRVAASGCDGVLMLLVGQDAVAFNRAFGRAGLDRDHIRFSPLMDENMLLASGAAGTRGLYAAAGYFETLPTTSSLDFGAAYHRRFGLQAPTLNSLGESCYEGVRLLTELVRRAGDVDVRRIHAVSEGLGYDGPRGPVEVRDRHLVQRVFLAVADGLQFDVIRQL